MNADVTASRFNDTLQAHAAPPLLVVLSYPRLRGLRFPVGTRLVIGRAPEAPSSECIAFNEDARASRSHAELRYEEGQCRVRDLGSKNGTFIDGERLTAETVLREGSVLRIGDTCLELEASLLVEEVSPPPPFIGEARRYRAVLARLAQLALGKESVLLYGETGTGKEHLARFVHDRSGLTGPYVTVNCAAISPSLFESFMFGHTRGAFTGAEGSQKGAFALAEDGTLFLDEIGELSLEQQAKLLRVLETGDFLPVGGGAALQSRARVVAATNAEESRFRPDLYARLIAGRVEVPPLRGRKLDIVPLFHRFVAEAAKTPILHPLSPDIVAHLLRRPWPFNLRELRALARTLVNTAGAAKDDPAAWNAHVASAVGLPLHEVNLPREAVSTHAPLPAPLQSEALPAPGPVADKPLAEPMERDTFIAAVREHKGNIVQIARALDRDRKQIYRWLERFGVSLDDYR